jgi:hypothetical protein
MSLKKCEGQEGSKGRAEEKLGIEGGGKIDMKGYEGRRSIC